MDNYFEVKTTVKITEKQINSMIVSAVEGGCSYWARFEFQKNWKDRCSSYEQIPMNGGKIEVFDIEEGELLGALSRNSIRAALQYMANGKDINNKAIPMRHFENLLNDTADAETADVFLQLCAMGEIVFG
ncbi:MAG: hypothetical protein JEZ07_03390 [Phycisphaerae bacterium]|nr:hypothetical protein [Phycisphaerae bacterium]